MKTVLILAALLGLAHARLQGCLSILPDLAFFFEGENSTLYDAQGTSFVPLGKVAPQDYFAGAPRVITGASYLLMNGSSETVTALFRHRLIYFVLGDKTVLLNASLSDLFTNAPDKVDAAFPVLDVNNTVVGTNLIFRRHVYECGAIYSNCIVRRLQDYAPGLSDDFLYHQGRVTGALGLPDGLVILFKKRNHATIINGVVQEERMNSAHFHGWSS